MFDESKSILPVDLPLDLLMRLSFTAPTFDFLCRVTETVRLPEWKDYSGAISGAFRMWREISACFRKNEMTELQTWIKFVATTINGPSRWQRALNDPQPRPGGTADERSSSATQSMSGSTVLTESIQ
jgi:hypothetical protein